MNKYYIGLCIICLFLLSACEEEAKRKVDSETTQATVESDSKSNEAETKEKVKAPISSPEKMFDFIHGNEIEYSKDLMNDASLASLYVQPQEKALNLGIYTTDLTYAAVYQDIESSVDLYKVVKRLGAELDIAEMMTPEMVEKMQAYMENPDSLAVVAARAYYQAVEFLESNEQNGKLALMSVGGWIESLYITMKAIDEIEEGSPTAVQIAEEMVNFKNLYAYLEANPEELGVKSSLDDLAEIHNLFESMSQAENKSINQEQYAKLKKAIIDYRDQIVEVKVKG